MDEISIKIGNRIKQLRNSRGISQEELADHADLNRAFFGQIERGQKNATVKTLNKICMALDISLHEFFSYDLYEVDPETVSFRKTASLLRQLDEREATQILDIMKKIVEFKNS